MFFKKKKKDLQIINVKNTTHLVLNGNDISKYVTEYIITQEGGYKPEVTIVCHPEKVDLLIEQLKAVKIKIEK